VLAYVSITCLGRITTVQTARLLARENAKNSHIIMKARRHVVTKAHVQSKIKTICEKNDFKKSMS